MQITSLLQKTDIQLGLAPMPKAKLLETMVDTLAESGAVLDKESCLAAVITRENQCSTGVGKGIAIPHCKGTGVAHTAIGAVTIPEGTEFDALDGEPVRLAFLIVTPQGGENEHIQVLARLSRLLMLPGFAEELWKAKNVQSFLKVVDEGEAMLAKEELEQARCKAEKAAAAGEYTVLAVTACPTGIAHTYMAAQALEQAAQEQGISLKVETNGAAGVQNALTQAEIANCKGIVVAADRAVPMERFAEKPVLRVPVAQAITQPTELLKRAAKGDAPKYQVKKTEIEQPQPKEGWLYAMYRHLMNGVSKILPLLVAAGVINALSLMVPASMTILVQNIGTAAQAITLVVLAGYIAASIGGEPAMTVGFATGVLTQLGVSAMGWCEPGFVGSILAGYVSGGVVRLLQCLFAKLPQAFSGLKPMLLYPVFGVAIAGLAVMVLNSPATIVLGVLRIALAAMPLWVAGIVGAVLGGMMAFDLGGPINKLAYAAGVLLLTIDHTQIMAAVMAAGMVPPLAVAVAAWICRKKVTQNERAAAGSNLLLGLCFISEGAMPMAARQPGAAKPAFIIGSAIAGACAMLGKCTCPAPHGGIFLLPFIQQPIAWLGAIALGVVISVAVLWVRLTPVKK